MVTQRQLDELLEGGIGGGFGNDDITNYFEPYDNRVEFVADDTYTIKDEENGKIYMSTVVLLRAIKPLTSMSSMIWLKEGYSFVNSSNLVPTGLCNYPVVDQSDYRSLNKQPTNLPNGFLIKWQFECIISEV